MNIADAWDDLNYEHYSLHEPAAALPLGIFEAAPVAGKKIVTMQIQFESPHKLSLIMFGSIWVFKSRLDDHGVLGAYLEDGDGREKRTYFRVMKDIDISETVQQEHVFAMLGDRVYKNLALRVVLDSDPEHGSPVSDFVERLREMPSLRFK